METHKIDELISLLERLHESSKDTSTLSSDKLTSDHTTLLLNSYIRAGQIEKLDSFLRSANNKSLAFDVNAIIDICRESKLYDQAAFLALHSNEEDLYVSILLQDMSKPLEALLAIRRMRASGVGRNLNAFGFELLNVVPDDTTKLFIEYYSGNYIPQTLDDQRQNRPELQSSLSIASSYLPSFQTFQKITGKVGSYSTFLPNRNTSTKPFEKSKSPPASIISSSDPKVSPPENSPLVNLGAKVTTYQPPKPRAAFPIFINNPTHFIEFLEGLILESKVDSGIEVDESVYLALFEAYLSQASSESNESDVLLWIQKAKNLLASQNKLDKTKALLISYATGFENGALEINVQEGRREDAIRAYISKGNAEKVIEMVNEHGDDAPGLYQLALRFFVSDANILEQFQTQVLKILDKVCEKGLLNPLQVINSLSTTAIATVGLVKPYLNKVLEKETREIQNVSKYYEKLSFTN